MSRCHISFFWRHPLVLGAVKDSESTVDISIQPSVRGRLFKCIDFWRTLPASQFILNVISQGYKIPFFQLPTPFYKANNDSARRNSSFVTIAVNELLSLNLIKEIFCAPDILLTRFLFRPNAPANKGLSWILLDTLTLLPTNRNSSASTCLWLLKFLTRVFIYSNLISSTGNTTSKFSSMTGNSLRSPFSQKFSNRFRNLGEARASLLSFFLTMV